MLFLFIASLSLDDVYTTVSLDNGETAEYSVQPNPKSAILLITKSEAFNITKKSVKETDYSSISPWKKLDRSEGLTEYVYSLKGTDPITLRITCPEACDMTLKNVHTEPVYRPSIVISSFTLFVMLFLFVFSWSLFCGGCRATRH